MASGAPHHNSEIEHARTLWDRAADAYVHQHENSPSFQHLLWPELKKVIDRTPMQTALDAGCGSGDLAGYLTQRGVKTTGVDFSPEMVRLAQSRHPGARFVEGDISKLDRTPLHNAFFDAVFCVNVLPNHPDYKGAIRDMAKRLKPSGHLVIAQLHPTRTYQQTSSGYFAEQCFESRFIGQDRPIKRWHRPLSNYFQACVEEQRLEIDEFHELGISSKTAHPDLLAWSKKPGMPKGPVFLVFDLVKPKAAA